MGQTPSSSRYAVPDLVLKGITSAADAEALLADPRKDRLGAGHLSIDDRSMVELTALDFLIRDGFVHVITVLPCSGRRNGGS